MSSATTSSRPKKNARSSASNASSPRYGHSVAGSGACTPGPAERADPLGRAEPLEAVGSEVDQLAPLGQVPGDELRGHRGQEDLAAVGLAAQRAPRG